MAETLNCRCCGSTLNTYSNLIVCEHCGVSNFISDVANRNVIQLNRANKLRQESEFDNAARIYDSIIAQNPPTADILWYRTLCEYGIEYVPDPVSDKYFPTLHRISDESILDCSFFKQAYELAEGEQKEALVKEAEYINEVQNKYLNIASNEAPYDVFICYKETDEESGEKTEDVKLAEELYRELTGSGYKVFFARETLKDKLSVDYEPYIFAALKSARAMAVIGTKAEYFTSVWVKNEWGRFLKLMKKDPGKQVFFACDDPEELPRAFANKQAQILGKEDAIRNLAVNIRVFLKDSGYIKTEEYNQTINQEEFDRLIASKTEGYLKKLSRTSFGVQEDSLKKDLLKLYGTAEITEKIYRKTFNAGAITLLAAEFVNIFYAVIRMFNYEESIKAKAFLDPLYLFDMLIIFAFLAGIIMLFSPLLLIELYGIRKNVSEYKFLVTMGRMAPLIPFTIIAHLFIYAVFPLFETVIMAVILLMILLVGVDLKLNFAAIENRKAFEQIPIKTYHLKKLKETAREEFFEFDTGQLEELKETGIVNDDVEIKDYHYDEKIEQEVNRRIADDYKLTEKMEACRTDMPEYHKRRVKITLIFALVSAVLYAVNIIIMHVIF